VTWVAWRLQRTETLIAGAVLLVLALLLLPSGLEMASVYRHDGLAACLGAGKGGPCGETIASFTDRFQRVANIVPWLTLVPGLIGVLFAAPFVGELENGTYRLAWTQSVTRRRWIAGKLGLAVGSTIAAAAVLTLFLTWWRTPLVHLHGRMDPSVFDSQGTVVAGYSLFALGLALAIGVLWRRTVPAILVAFVGYFGARLFVDFWVRQHLVAPVRATWSAVARQPADYWNAWVISEQPSDRFGHPVRLLGHCGKPITPHPKGIADQCIVKLSSGFTHAVYEPASRFWPLQAAETSLFAGAALVLIGLAAWWTHRRAA
jgi:hypothetical protein